MQRRKLGELRLQVARRKILDEQVCKSEGMAMRETG